jgi:UDP-N-acetylglucosamine 1-carboxyvinyltransferase
MCALGRACLAVALTRRSSRLEPQTRSSDHLAGATAGAGLPEIVTLTDLQGGDAVIAARKSCPAAAAVRSTCRVNTCIKKGGRGSGNGMLETSNRQSTNYDTASCLEITPTRLSGVVSASGAKNSALRLLAASILSSGTVRLERFPATLSDARLHIDMLTRLGKRTTVAGAVCVIEEPTALATTLEWSGRSIRNTLLILGALAARFGEARVPVPGGCEIGDRRFDLHQQLLEACGFRVSLEGGMLGAVRSRQPNGLVEYHSPLRSTGVTENALLVGSLMRSGLRLHNPHVTPEVLDLAGYLESQGVEVTLLGSESMLVRGVESVPGRAWKVMPDRIEAMTWAAAAIASRGDIEIEDFPFPETAIAREYLVSAGARIYVGERSIIVRSDGPRPIELSAGSHPAVHSDMQPLFGALAALANGRSEIVDLRYPERFHYLDELARLGATASYANGHALVQGAGRLRGGTVFAADLRAAAALAVAGLGADSPVAIENAWQLFRGYDRFVEKVERLGGVVDITWSPDRSVAD